MSTDLNQKLRQKAYDYLSRREHSVLELYDKLARYSYKLPEADQDKHTAINQVIDTLQERDHLSNKRYAERFLQSKVKQLKGPQLIKQQLHAKGITPKLWSQVWQEADIDEPEICREALKSWRKRHSLKDLTTVKTKAKAMRFLLQRGFYTRTIQAVLHSEIN